MYKNTGMKKYDILFNLAPKYNRKCNELLFKCFTVPIREINFKNCYISNHGKSTTNHKSIHFLIKNKELTEEEIRNCILSVPKNETSNYIKKKTEYALLYQSCLKSSN